MIPIAEAKFWQHRGRPGSGDLWAAFSDVMGKARTARETWAYETRSLKTEAERAAAYDLWEAQHQRFWDAWMALRKYMDAYFAEELDLGIAWRVSVRAGTIVDSNLGEWGQAFAPGLKPWGLVKLMAADAEDAGNAIEKMLEDYFPTSLNGSYGIKVWSAHPPWTGLRRMDAALRRIMEARRMLARVGVERIVKGRNYYLGAGSSPWDEQELDADTVTIAAGEYVRRATGPLRVAGFDGVVHPPAGSIGLAAAMGMQDDVTGRTGGQRFTQTLLHELGHAFYYEEMDQGARVEWDRMWKLASHRVSAYAGKHPAEGFAETFYLFAIKKNPTPIDTVFADRDGIARFRALLRGDKMGSFKEAVTEASPTQSAGFLELSPDQVMDLARVWEEWRARPSWERRGQPVWYAHPEVKTILGLGPMEKVPQFVRRLALRDLASYKTEDIAMTPVLGERLMLKSGFREYAAKVADAYDARPVRDPAAVASYAALLQHSERMFKQLQSRIRIEFVDEDEPYANAAEMTSRVKAEGVMYVSTLFSENLVSGWTAEQNWRFRAVHDYIVHIGGGHDFSLRGEMATFNRHAKVVPKAALPALFSEIMGQVAYFLDRGKFPTPQKACVLYGFDYTRVGYIDPKEYRRNWTTNVRESTQEDIAMDEAQLAEADAMVEALFSLDEIQTDWLFHATKARNIEAIAKSKRLLAGSGAGGGSYVSLSAKPLPADFGVYVLVFRKSSIKGRLLQVEYTREWMIEHQDQARYIGSDWTGMKDAREEALGLLKGPHNIANDIEYYKRQVNYYETEAISAKALIAFARDNIARAIASKAASERIEGFKDDLAEAEHMLLTSRETADKYQGKLDKAKKLQKHGPSEEAIEKKVKELVNDALDEFKGYEREEEWITKNEGKAMPFRKGELVAVACDRCDDDEIKGLQWTFRNLLPPRYVVSLDTAMQRIRARAPLEPGLPDPTPPALLKAFGRAKQMVGAIRWIGGKRHAYTGSGWKVIGLPAKASKKKLWVPKSKKALPPYVGLPGSLPDKASKKLWTPKSKKAPKLNYETKKTVGLITVLKAGAWLPKSGTSGYTFKSTIKGDKFWAVEKFGAKDVYPFKVLAGYLQMAWWSALDGNWRPTFTQSALADPAKALKMLKIKSAAPQEKTPSTQAAGLFGQPAKVSDAVAAGVWLPQSTNYLTARKRAFGQPGEADWWINDGADIYPVKTVNGKLQAAKWDKTKFVWYPAFEQVVAPSTHHLAKTKPKAVPLTV